MTALVNIPAGPAKAGALPTVTIACPARMKFAGYVEPERRIPLDWQNTRETLPGVSTKARIDLSQRDTSRAVKGTTGIICKRPHPNGSLRDNPYKLRPGEKQAHICVSRHGAGLYRSPGRDKYAFLGAGEPVAIRRRNATGRWTFVARDPGPIDPIAPTGWVMTSKLCP